MFDNLNKIYFITRKGKGKIFCYEANEQEKHIFKCIELNKKQIDDRLLEYGGFIKPICFHIYALPEQDRKELIRLLGQDKFPRNAYYSDGSKIEEASLEDIRLVYEQERCDNFR